MGIVQALVVVLVLIVAGWFLWRIVRADRPGAGSCMVAVVNAVLQAGRLDASVPCCAAAGGGCLPGFATTMGTVALIPTKLSAACPIQKLDPSEYGVVIDDPGNNAPFPVNTAALAKMYRRAGCGDIQVALTRQCYIPGLQDPTRCHDDIAAVRGSMSETVVCPSPQKEKDPLLPTRRLLLPSVFSLTSCPEPMSYDFPVGTPKASVTINAAKDAGGAPGGAPCQGHTLDEILYYRCPAKTPGS